MKKESIIEFLFSIIICVSLSLKDNVVANRIENSKGKINTAFKKALNTHEEITDPNVIFELAIEDYKIQFTNYINITALNVFDKEKVDLPNFDLKYVAPKYYDVMFDYQQNLESSLTYEQNLKYIELQKKDYNFDRYVTLNSIKYADLKPNLKYDHINVPISPINPITPTNPTLPPDIGIMSAGNQQNNVAVATAGIVTILTNAGLGQSVITAFTAAISTLTMSISTSWIPFIGQVLAVALAVGALIALTVIIVENWDVICSIIDDIKNWFSEQFYAFSSLVNTYFDDAMSQGEESTIAAREVIDGKQIEWKDAKMTRDVAIAIATDLRRDNSNVLLMRNLTFPTQNEMNWWVPTAYLNINFVIKNKLCQAPFYYSTYTWYNSNAKCMLYESTPSYSNYGGYGYKNLVYHKFTTMTKAIYGWNHYHVGKYDPSKNKASTYPENEPIHSVHSFFGLTYVRLSNNDGFASFPSNP